MDKTPKSSNLKKPSALSIFIILIVSMFIVSSIMGVHNRPAETTVVVSSTSDLYDALVQERVEDIKVFDDPLAPYVTYREANGEIYKTHITHEMVPGINDRAVEYNSRKYKEGDEGGKIKLNTIPPEAPGIISQLGPIGWIFVAILGVMIYQLVQQNKMRSQAMGGAGAQDQFGKSKAVVRKENNIKVRFADVHAPDAVEQMREAVDLLKDPKRFEKLGGQMPKGAALVGPPGTGKTLLAKAVAGEAGVPFLSLSGSDFAEMFVGVAAARVRDLFAQGRAEAPCIIFIDEVDSIGGKRSASPMGGEKETEGGLNALLKELDGFDDLVGVLFMCATNRVDALDPALMRPGRIDRVIELNNPDLLAREEIFKIHMRNKPISKSVSPRDLARGTSGMNGGQIAAICNEAALITGRSKRDVVTMRDFEAAKDKILMGRENKTMVMTDHEKMTTAYHEAGHTIVGFLAPEHDPVYKVSIIPRTGALGITMFLPERDRVSMSKRGLKGMLWSLYAGRIAETMINGDDGVTTGAQNDEQRATMIADNMVRLWDMSDNPLLRHRTFAEDGSGLQHLGGRGLMKTQTSEDFANAVDKEIQKITQEAYANAEEILRGRQSELNEMAAALIKWETIGRPQIDAIMSGKKITDPDFPVPTGFEEELLETVTETTA